MAFDRIFHYFSVHCEAVPIEIATYGPRFLAFTDVLFIKCCGILFPFLDKSFSKAFAISEEDSMCPNAMICSTDTCFLDYLSNDKAGHSGKTMSPGVRKRKRHKLCNRLFTIFFFQKFNTDIAVIYRPKKEMHHNFWKRA